MTLIHVVKNNNLVKLVENVGLASVFLFFYFLGMTVD